MGDCFSQTSLDNSNGDFAADYISGMSVIPRCLQGKS